MRGKVDTTRDREFLSDPSRWPNRHMGQPMTCLKQLPEKWDSSVGYSQFGFVVLVPDGTLGLFIQDRQNPDKYNPTFVPVTVDSLLADGWVVD